MGDMVKQEKATAAAPRLDPSKGWYDPMDARLRPSFDDQIGQFEGSPRSMQHVAMERMVNRDENNAS